MRILCCGDWHLTDKKPRSRTDDYRKATEKKINQVKDINKEYNTDIIIQAGDFTDSHESPDKFKVRWIDNFRDIGESIYTVPGQHDLRYHTSDIWNTPLGVLSQSVGIHVINDDRPVNLFDDALGERIDLYGAGWGKDIPEPKVPGIFNILITHRMIVMDKLWAAQENYEVAGTILRDNPEYQLIVSGDNHKSFHYEHNGRWLINCGSLMRSNIDQINHRPCVWIYDTECGSAEQICLDIEPFEEVMDIERAEREKAVAVQKNDRMDKLEMKLRSESKITGLDYSARVAERVKLLQREDMINPIAVEIIGEIMGEE